MNDISHSQIIMWTVGFFFSGVAATSFIFWAIGRGLKKTVRDAIKTMKEDNIQNEREIKTLELNLNSNYKSTTRRLEEVISSFETKIKKLEVTKVDIIIYDKDQEKAERIIKSLQTIDGCVQYQHVCQGAVLTKLDYMSKALDQVVENQQEVVGVSKIVTLVEKRQQEVIERIDKHINGHKHND